MNEIDVILVKALDRETATSLLIEMIEAFVEGDPDLAGSTCSCCEQKRLILNRLKNAGVLRR